MIKVLIADDQELIRQSLSIVLNTKEGIEVTDTVANGQEVIASVCIFHLSSASFPEIQSTQIRYFRAGISAL